MNEESLRSELERLCTRLYDRRLVSGCGGNVAGRLGRGMIVTPSGGSLGDVTAEDLVVVDADGNFPEGCVPTKEAGLHRAILDARSDALIVIHTHNPAATAVSTLVEPTPDVLPPLTPGFAAFGWPLPLIAFHVPGTQELVDAVVANLPEKNAILLQNHGLVVWGSSPSQALIIAEEIEEAAHVYLVTGGKARPIAPETARRIR